MGRTALYLLLLSLLSPVSGVNASDRDDESAPPDPIPLSRIPERHALVVGEEDTSGWIPLFNGADLTGWRSFLGVRSTKDTGLVEMDFTKIFQVVDGVIHLYRDSPADAVVAEGFLMTEKEYGSYRLRLEFTWGTKKFKQRTGKKRNSGLMFHAQDSSGFWPTSIECQIMEGDVGDIYTQNHAWCTTTIDTILTDSLSRRSVPRYSPSGRLYEHGGPGSRRVMQRSAADSTNGWNMLEIVVRGSEADFMVNGRPSSSLWNIRYVDPRSTGVSRPLSRGRILLQAEATEILFRNIRIRVDRSPGGQ